MLKSACGNHAEVPLSGVRPNSALLDKSSWSTLPPKKPSTVVFWTIDRDGASAAP